MNGTSIIAWRKYESAVDRLKKITACLEGDQREATLAKINIAQTHTDARGDGVVVLAAALAELIRDDLPKHIAAAIAKARADVTASADEVVSAIKADLQSKYMRG